MNDKQLILFCIQKIEEVFSHGSSAQWTHQHFVLLSEQIEKRTGIIISATTLKRFFGKRSTDHTYLPQLGTRDALSQYAGFENWQNLCEQAPKRPSKPEESIKLHKNTKPRYRNTKWVTIVFLSIAVLSIIVLFYLNSRSAKVPEYQVTLRNPVDTVPFTAIFDYQVPANSRDTFFLEMENFEKVPLLPHHSTFTQWIKSAGYHSAKLYYKNRVLDTIYINAQNKDWQAGFWRYDLEGQFQPLNQTDTQINGIEYLHIPPSCVQKSGIDSLSRYWTEFRLFNNYNANLDKCEVSLEARNNKITGGKPCFDIDLELVGENGRIQVVFTQEKCSRFVKLTLGEKQYDGRNYDLSFLSTDVKHWTNFEIITEEKDASILINGVEVFQEQYSQSLGELKGIIIRFFGSGQVRSIELKDKSGRLFLNNFED